MKCFWSDRPCKMESCIFCAGLWIKFISNLFMFHGQWWIINRIKRWLKVRIKAWGTFWSCRSWARSVLSGFPQIFTEALHFSNLCFSGDNMAQLLTRPLPVHFSTRQLRRLSHEEVISALELKFDISNIKAIQITEKECIVTVENVDVKNKIILEDLRVQNRFVNVTDVERNHNKCDD